MSTALLEPPPAAAAVPSLKGEAAGAVRWSALAQAARVGVGLVTTAALAWLLGPAEFGLAGMAAVAVGFVTLCKDLGTGAAVVQRQDLTVRELATIHWLNFGASLLGAGLLVLLAPLCAAFFREPRLTALVATLGLALVVSGPGVVPQSLLQRRLRFDLLARGETAGLVAGAAVGIGLAALGAGAHSLVWQAIVNQGVTTALNTRACAYRPVRAFEPAALRRVLGFSLGVTAFNTCNFLVRNADQALLGRFAGASELGLYALAYRLVLQPLASVHAVVGRVLLPLYSRIQSDQPRIAEALTRVLGAVALSLLPLLAILAACAEPLVVALFGPRWQPAAALVPWLAAAAAVQMLVATASTLYQSQGRTDWLWRWGLASSAVAVLGFAIGATQGARGVAVALLVVGLVLLGPGLAIPCSFVKLPVRRALAAVRGPLVLSVGLALLLIAARHAFLGAASALVQCAVLLPLGMAAHVALAAAFERERVRDLGSLLRGGREA